MDGLATPRDARANRYTAADRDSAYWVWRTTGGRSYRRTAAITGIERETLARWATDGEWIARADREDTEDIGSIRHAVAAVITHQLVPNIETAIAIRDNEANSARDRLAAIQWLSGLAGIAPLSRVETAIRPADPSASAAAPELGNLSPDQLMALEAEYRAKR